jgi:hypothetical protein
MFDAGRRLREIDLHPAHRIAFFRLLHGAIMTVFAHFALFRSDQRSAAMKMAAGPQSWAFVRLNLAMRSCYDGGFDILRSERLFFGASPV